MFNFTENVSSGGEFSSDEFDERDELMLLDLGTTSSVDVDIPRRDFHETFLETLHQAQHTVDHQLVDGWLHEDDFLLKRWGLTLSGITEDGEDHYSMKIGLWKGRADISMVHLFEAVTRGSSPSVTTDCDLSPHHKASDNKFPGSSPNNILRILPLESKYVLTVDDGTPRNWKLLIDDPLVLLQVEREGWHLQADGLITRMVEKGLPFKVLYPSCQAGTAFYPNVGPILHPDGRSPTFTDYLAYRLDVADFFKIYPHAHVAALCSGNILWRIAVDVLPIPAEQDMIRPFNPSHCEVYIIDHQQYWTPILTDLDEQVIVGVHKWSGKLADNSPDPLY